MPVEVAPGGFSMEQQHGASRQVALVEVVDAQRSTVLVRHLGAVRLEREVG